MKRYFLTFFLFAAVFQLIFSFFPSRSSAAFVPNNLMDDTIFNNSTSMSASQIDIWLNSFPNSCISPNRGFSAPDPTGYSPSGGYVYGSPVTAGQVIYDASQAYGINPQVLLTTLQKEEGLIRGDGPYGCSALALSASVGYGCPDSGGLHDYSNLSPAMYYINNVPVNSVNQTCVNSASKAGFSQQIIRAAWLLKFGQQRSQGNIGWAVIKGDWNNSDDPQTCYGGPMTQGYNKRCSSDTDTVYYDGYTTIDGASTHMDTGSTAAFYWYTPHFSGNQNFNTIFTSWFGSVYSGCNLTGLNGKVLRLYRPQNHDYLYTADLGEACTALTKVGYYADDFTFTETPSSNGGVALYRLVAPGSNYHFYTVSAAERDTAVNTAGYRYEGVAMYVKGSSGSGYSPVYRLYKNGEHIFTQSVSERDSAVSGLGYINEGVAFYVPTNTANNIPIFRLRAAAGSHFYTSSTSERDYAISHLGYTYEGVAFWGQAAYNNNSIPAYRVSAWPLHVFTSTLSERTALLQRGFSNEGIGFYVSTPSTSGTMPVYRLYRASDGDHLLTTSASERDSIIKNNGYVYEGVAFASFQ